jgi:hypothetical protein
MTIVAGAYFGFHHAGITRKQNGRLPLVSRVVLAPWLVGHQLSLMYYRRQASCWNEVVPNVWIGRKLNDRDAALALQRGVTAVVDLTTEFSKARPFHAIAYLNLPILDLTAPTLEQLRSAVDFISAHRDAGVVLVHCKIGYSRSAAVVGSWLLDAGLAATPEAAVARICAARPGLVVRPEAWTALREFSRSDRLANRTIRRLIEVRT